MRILCIVLLTGTLGLWAGSATPPLPVKGAAPDREYQLPKDELVPSEIVILADAGDVADWGHAAIGVPDAWKVTKGKGAVVAVLDTGCDTQHRDLKNQVIAGKDFTNSRSSWADVNGHGTFCAGEIAAEANDTGMVGVAPEAKILVAKVLGDSGSGRSSWIVAGIDWAIENKADVISMSLGSDAPDDRIEAAVKRALAKGIIVVAAAGNSGPGENTAGWPGSFDGVVCVAATNNTNAVARFSSRGAAVAVAAPGVDIRGPYPGDRFATMSGTSMATPYVAGCAALYVSHCKAGGRAATSAEFAKLIADTSKDLPPAGRDTASGFGLIQAAKLMPGTPKPPDDRLILEPGKDLPVLIGGRKVKRIIFEFEP